jgi:DNA-binding protein H-NS
MPRLTVTTLDKKIKALQKARSKAAAKDAAAVSKKATKVRALMKKLGVSLSDLGGSAPAKRGRKPAAAAGAPAKRGRKPGSGSAKYKNPATGESWTGVGRPPRWITEAVKAGKSKDDFKA